MLIPGMAITGSVMSHYHNREVSLIGDSQQSDLISPLRNQERVLFFFFFSKKEFYFGKILGTELIAVRSH